MPDFHPLAAALNETISRGHPPLFDLLSERGRQIYFPFGGILGQTAEAKGKKWNATIGIALNDDGSPMRLASMDACIRLDPRDVYPYASSFGRQELREAWRAMLYEKNPSLKAEVSLPVVASGLTHCLSMAAYVFLDPGETLLLPDLFWGNYNLMFQHVYGARFRTFPTFRDGRCDLQGFRECLSGEVGKKVVLLNFPNNPAGYTPTTEEAAEIVSIIRERAEAGDTLAVILDDAYFGLVYEEGVYGESLFAPLADLHERVLVLKVDGATKEDFVWGHRVGFLTFAAKGMTAAVRTAFESKLAGAVRATVSNGPHVSQSLLLAAYRSPTYAQEKRANFAKLRERYEEVKRVLGNPKYAEFFTSLPFNSGYFMCVELAKGLDAEAIRKLLIAEYDTGVITLGNRFRIAYSSLPTRLIASFFDNLYDACSSYSLSHADARSLAGGARAAGKGRSAAPRAR